MAVTGVQTCALPICKLCYSKCPQKCIDLTQKPVVIEQAHCLHCGNCYEICPARAIERRDAR